MENVNLYLVALGGNVASADSSPQQMIHNATLALKANFPNLSVSAHYQTPAYPEGSGPDFVNAACTFSSKISPLDVLSLLHGIEADFRRERAGRWAARTLDLDLIAAGSAVLPDDATHDYWRELPLNVQMKKAPSNLILPHPRVQDRGFVLVPLADVAPDWVHPRLNLSVREMLARRPAAEIAQITRLP